jgi:hypothetical protein
MNSLVAVCNIISPPERKFRDCSKFLFKEETVAWSLLFGLYILDLEGTGMSGNQLDLFWLFNRIFSFCRFIWFRKPSVLPAVLVDKEWCVTRKKSFGCTVLYTPQTNSYILIMKANEMHCFSDLFDKVLYMFRTSPLSIIRRISTLYTCIRYLSCKFCWLSASVVIFKIIF